MRIQQLASGPVRVTRYALALHQKSEPSNPRFRQGPLSPPAPPLPAIKHPYGASTSGRYDALPSPPYQISILPSAGAEI